jgi:hypothetical protein
MSTIKITIGQGCRGFVVPIDWIWYYDGSLKQSIVLGERICLNFEGIAIMKGGSV